MTAIVANADNAGFSFRVAVHSAGRFFLRGAIGTGFEISAEITARPVNLTPCDGVSSVDNVRINEASQEILQSCFSADDPVAMYARLDRLRGDGHWTELELRRLQLILLEMAKRIASNRTADAP